MIHSYPMQRVALTKGGRPAREGHPPAALRFWQDQGGGEETGKEGYSQTGREQGAEPGAAHRSGCAAEDSP